MNATALHPPRAAVLSAIALALLIAGCASVSKVASGETVIRNKLTVTVAEPWNQFDHTMGGNTPTWTQEGFTVDALQFYVGIRNNEVIEPTPSGSKAQPLNFRSTMQPAEIVALYQGLWTRDGSSFTLDRIEPALFAGKTGFRFDYTLVRKSDDVRLSGIAWGAVHNGELYLINFSAPKLGFFARHVGRVEALVRTAAIKG
jgi:hypothetical protein